MNHDTPMLEDTRQVLGIISRVVIMEEGLLGRQARDLNRHLTEEDTRILSVMPH